MTGPLEEEEIIHELAAPETLGLLGKLLVIALDVFFFPMSTSIENLD